MLPKDLENNLLNLQKFIIDLQRQKEYLMLLIENRDETLVIFDVTENKKKKI